MSGGSNLYTMEFFKNKKSARVNVAFRATRPTGPHKVGGLRPKWDRKCDRHAYGNRVSNNLLDISETNSSTIQHKKLSVFLLLIVPNSTDGTGAKDTHHVRPYQYPYEYLSIREMSAINFHHSWEFVTWVPSGVPYQLSGMLRTEAALVGWIH